MPTNKNALIRYKVLDRCFSDFRRRYEIDDLIDEVNETLYDLYGTSVSLRQIREDIKYMRDRVTYDAPIRQTLLLPLFRPRLFHIQQRTLIRGTRQPPLHHKHTRSVQGRKQLMARRSSVKTRIPLWREGQV